VFIFMEWGEGALRRILVLGQIVIGQKAYQKVLLLVAVSLLNRGSRPCIVEEVVGEACEGWLGECARALTRTKCPDQRQLVNGQRQPFVPPTNSLLVPQYSSYALGNYISSVASSRRPRATARILMLGLVTHPTDPDMAHYYRARMSSFLARAVRFPLCI
jgi:hypothetical protein